ncbi:MAG: PKD domain-containing protein [Chitinophagaceae bacterium]|nr:PKD domain-containing protein [Chitinophagaceae bacterium]
MTFPYQPTSIQWQFGLLSNAMGIADVNIPAPVPTSTTVVNGKTLYNYQLPTPYVITAAGTYPIRVVATNPTPDGCGGTQEIDFDVQAFDPPVADFNFTTNGCVTSPVSFTDNSNTNGRPVISRHWNFGDANTSALNNPSHTYAAPGSYTVKYSLITDIGCIADTASRVVTINDPPVALFTAAAPYCEGRSVTFTDQSTSPGGATISQWTWDFGDGSPVVVRNTSTNETHTYASAGSYTATLRVVTSSGCQSTLFSFPVTIIQTRLRILIYQLLVYLLVQRNSMICQLLVVVILSPAGHGISVMQELPRFKTPHIIIQPRDHLM